MHITDGKTYDLIVCGGDMAGFTTAVQGARAGLRTALVERHDKMADGPHWIYGVHVNIPAAACAAIALQHDFTDVRNAPLEEVRALLRTHDAIVTPKDVTD